MTAPKIELSFVPGSQIQINVLPNELLEIETRHGKLKYPAGVIATKAEAERLGLLLIAMTANDSQLSIAAVAELRKQIAIVRDGDPVTLGAARASGPGVLRDLLRDLGYSDAVDAFDALELS